MFKETQVLMHSDKISKDIKLLVFSDIHFSGNHDIKKLEKLIEKVKTYEIDYICIPGDTIDVPNINCDYMVKFFTKLGNIAPVILSLGNHDIRIKYQEYKSYFDNDFWDKISKIDNVYLLNNNCKSFKDVYFYGFTQSFNYYYEYKNENNSTGDTQLFLYAKVTNGPIVFIGIMYNTQRANMCNVICKSEDSSVMNSVLHAMKFMLMNDY